MTNTKKALGLVIAILSLSSVVPLFGCACTPRRSVVDEATTSVTLTSSAVEVPLQLRWETRTDAMIGVSLGCAAGASITGTARLLSSDGTVLTTFGTRDLCTDVLPETGLGWPRLTSSCGTSCVQDVRLEVTLASGAPAFTGTLAVATLQSDDVCASGHFPSDTTITSLGAP